MNKIEKLILSVKNNQIILDSVNSIDGAQHKPQISAVIGKAWPKKTTGGRPYYKMQFDCFKSATGKKLYAKAWSLKSDPKTFDVFVDKADLPFLSPFLFETAGRLVAENNKTD